MEVHDVTWKEDYQKYLKDPDNFEFEKNDLTRKLFKENCVLFDDYIK